MRPPVRSGGREALDKVPPFLLKLWEILENNSVPTDGSRPCVSWGFEGKSFVIHETEMFARSILPLYFKHDNIRSFMRQLNIYNFTRCAKKANSTGNPSAVEFSHASFVRG
ncbi:HSF-type DNA-binding-domain-containing protein, partial [Pavlovales sp. CCMP2436]